MNTPCTTARVRLHTPDAINEPIRHETEKNIARYAAGDATAINQRLAELGHEWDIERTLEANASILTLAGLALGRSLDRRFLILPVAVAGCLLQHAIQGWSPPLAVLRRMGFRTASEIDEERFALKALRGDFDNLSSISDREYLDSVARLQNEGGPAYEPKWTAAHEKRAIQEVLEAVRR